MSACPAGKHPVDVRLTKVYPQETSGPVDHPGDTMYVKVSWWIGRWFLTDLVAGKPTARQIAKMYYIMYCIRSSVGCPAAELEELAVAFGEPVVSGSSPTYTFWV